MEHSSETRRIRIQFSVDINSLEPIVAFQIDELEVFLGPINAYAIAQMLTEVSIKATVVGAAMKLHYEEIEDKYRTQSPLNEDMSQYLESLLSKMELAK